MTLNHLCRTLALASLCLGLATGSLAGETYFKCTKANKEVSYTENKPTTGCETVEEVKVSTGRGVVGNAQQTSITPKEETKKPEIAGVEDRKAAVSENCEIQRANLATMRNTASVSEKDAQGNIKPLSAEEIEQRIANAEKYLQDFCSGQ